jgi:hypothetical protein
MVQFLQVRPEYARIVNILDRLERLAMDIHSSLFCPMTEKKFYNIDIISQCYKTFYSLQMLRQNKLERLSLAKSFWAGLKYAPFGYTLALPTKIGPGPVL